MTWDEMVQQALDYFEDNIDVFNMSIEELDSNKGYLDNARREPMDFINDIYCDWNVKDIMRDALEGSDADGGKFDPDRYYFYRSGWGGSLISTDSYDYSYYLDRWFIESLFDHYVYYLEKGWGIDEYETPEFIRNLFEDYIAENGREH